MIQISSTWLVEIVISTNHVPDIWIIKLYSETQVSGRLSCPGVNPLDMPRTPDQMSERKHSQSRTATLSSFTLSPWPRMHMMTASAQYWRNEGENSEWFGWCSSKSDWLWLRTCCYHRLDAGPMSEKIRKNTSAIIGRIRFVIDNRQKFIKLGP